MAKKTLLDAQNLAKSKQGKCLSDTYINSRANLTWECSKGHTWEARYTSISSNGSWCPHCKKLSMKEIKKLASSNEGVFLDKVYANSNKKHNWKCSKGHTFQKRVASVKNGSWCPMCASESKLPKAIDYNLTPDKDNIREIRIQNILSLISQYKTQIALAKKLNVSPARISHYKNGFIGDKACREIELKLNLPEKYMDEFHGKLFLNQADKYNENHPNI